MKDGGSAMNKTHASVAALVIFLLLPRLTVADDGRVVVLLDEPARKIMLDQMRFFMQGVAAIMDALSIGNMEIVAREARARGGVMPERVPVEIRNQLPSGFLAIGKTVHMGFDQLAADAKQFGDAQQCQQQLAEIIRGCSACHATYQIRSSTFDPMQ